MRYILIGLTYFTSNLYAQFVNNIRLLGNQNNIEVYYDFSGDVNTVLDIVGFQIIEKKKADVLKKNTTSHLLN